MTTSHDDPHGDLLARALHEEAARIVPAGDGLTKIRDRVQRRRVRSRWLIPSASALTAAALGAAAFGAYTVASNDDSLRTQQPAGSRSGNGGPTGTTSPSGTPSTSPSGSVSPSGLPTSAITPVWPFNTAAEAAQFEQTAADGHSPWHLDAAATATFFVQDALGFTDQRIVAVKDTTSGQRSGDVTLGTKTTASGRTVVFATAHLVRWGSGRNAPWEITGVDAPGARIDAPARDASVSSPLSVKYTLDGGVEENVTVSVHDGQGQLAAARSVIGGGQHSATLRFTSASTSNGYVVMADVQGLSSVSTLGRLAVVPVRFAATTPPPSSPGQKYPTYFVAVKDGRLALYYSTSGGFDRWLTAPDARFPASDPQLDASRTWVYYLAGPSELRRVKVTGGTPETVQKGEPAISAFAVGGQSDELLATVQTSTDTATHQQQMSVQWSNSKTGATGGFTMPNPATAEQLAWAPDGRHLAATVRTGTAWGIETFDVTTAKTGNDGVTLPCPNGNSCSAPSYDAAGNLYFIAAPDAFHWQLLQWTGSKVMHVSTWTLAKQASPETATVDITPDAETALVGTPAGAIYRIEHGQAALVPTDAGTPTW